MSESLALGDEMPDRLSIKPRHTIRKGHDLVLQIGTVSSHGVSFLALSDYIPSTGVEASTVHLAMSQLPDLLEALNEMQRYHGTTTTPVEGQLNFPGMEAC